MIIGTAGHIDHGKTALIKALTGIDADRLKEEKERGITIDLGYVFYPLPHGAVLGFIDVPGHERFVHNMLAGATGIDFVLLVVAADDGVMPQTREHLEIIDLLGVRAARWRSPRSTAWSRRAWPRRRRRSRPCSVARRSPVAPCLPCRALTAMACRRCARISRPWPRHRRRHARQMAAFVSPWTGVSRLPAAARW